MLVVDETIVKRLEDALNRSTIAIERLSLSEAQLRNELERVKLLTEKEAGEYLKRDEDTLRYYRTLGLNSYKKGKDRWYTKGDIDDWLGTGKVNRHSR